MCILDLWRIPFRNKTNPLRSVAQMLVNEDCYAHSYTTTKHLNYLPDIVVATAAPVRRKWRTPYSSLRAETMVMKDCQSAVVGGA